VLRRNKRWLDYSGVQLDGSHTPAKNDGAAVGYQRRKKSRTTTALFLADKQGQPLACATPQAANHHDNFQLAALFEEPCVLLEEAGIAVAGLFLNADSAFGTTGLRQACAARHIEANIARNRRAAIGKPTTTPSLTPNSTANVPWSNTPTLGPTASKPCLCAMKLASAIGWPFIDSHSSSSFLRKIKAKTTF